MVKKVLFIFHDTDYISGATLSMLDLIENFNKNENLSCMVLVPNKTGTAIDYLKSKKIPILYSKYYQIKYNLDERPIKKICHMPKNILKLIVSIVNTYRLIPLVKRNEIDVVYSNTGFVINGALIKKKLPYIKHIWHIREFGEEDHHYGIVIGRRLYYWIQNKYTDDIIYISNSLYKKFRPHIHKPSVHIIYDDISKIYYQEYERVYKKDDKMNILFAGTIQLGKGQMDAVRLLHRLVELKIPAQLSLAGRLTDIKYVNEIKEYIKKYDLEEYITFLGLVEDMNSLRHNTDFGIVSSRSEAFGRVTIEGMLSGMVMIGADANGTSELITNGKNGFLYRLGDINMLTEIFVNLWNNPDIVNNVSKAARSYSKKFIEGDCAKELTNIFMGNETMDKPKVGILTLYYNNYNFGGMLQAYALQRVIEVLGIECEQICYDRSPLNIERVSRLSIIRGYFDKGLMWGLKKIMLKLWVKILNLMICPKLKYRIMAFEQFQSLIPHSDKIYRHNNLKECNKKYDVFLCGGDQIWNGWYESSKNYAPHNFTLDFVSNDKIKLSYSASIGGIDLPKEYIENLKPGMQSLNFISVREKSSVPLIAEISNKEVETALDSTLLIDENKWDELALDANVAIPKDKYSLCYFLGTSAKQRKAVSKYVHMNDSKVLAFPYIRDNLFQIEDIKFGDIRDFTSGPAEFVKLIKYAKFVITDSFHAIVFSMIYHKPFYVFERETIVGSGTMNTRIYDFLEEFGLQSRLVTTESLLNKKEIEPIDYAYADLVLKRRKRESLEFLKNALELDK